MAGHYDPCATLHLCTRCDDAAAIPAIYQRREVQRFKPATNRGGTERTMCDQYGHSERRPSDKGCGVCGGKFGLIRYYSWRTALCSKKCLDRFRARSERDRRWLFRAQTGVRVNRRAGAVQSL
jgi:hypothetical protein